MPKFFAHNCPTINALNTVIIFFMSNFRKHGVFQQDRLLCLTRPLPV
jgi:hypothetical protein